MSRCELRFGAPVMVGEKRVGELCGVRLDSAGRRWQAVVIRGGRLRRTHWLALRSDVCEADEQRIVLKAMPTIRAAAIELPGVSGNARVRAHDGRTLGRPALVRAAADGRLWDLVVEHPDRGLSVIPATALTGTPDRELVVDLSCEVGSGSNAANGDGRCALDEDVVRVHQA